MWIKLIICLALASFVAARIQFVDLPSLKPLKTSADRARDHGYPSESHHVETKDGYILGVFRIPYSHKLNNKDVKRPVVFLQHGLFSCSDCWLLAGPDNSLAYLLVDAGFDVWLGNGRGNIYSQNHTTMSLNHPYFWKFSWHEIGVRDLPDTIDYILEQTGQSSLHYVGHSQGGTSYLVMMSSIPEMSEKVRSTHLLAPAAFMTNTDHDLVAIFYPTVGVYGAKTRLLENQEFLPSNPLLQRTLDTLCGGSPAFPEFCRTLFLTWAGTEATNTNRTLLPQIAETHPAGISTNQGIHYIQLSDHDLFRQYDHGTKLNWQIYGAATPPEYDLAAIRAKINIYYGLSDTSTSYKDIRRLPDYISTIEQMYEVPDPSWGHIDFIFATKVKETINDRVVKGCLDYENLNSA